jgi:hypothetical protein
MADDLVRVLSTRSVPEAEVVRMRLEDEGIPVMATGLDSVYRMGPIDLYVPASLEVQARLVLASAEEAAIEEGAEEAVVEDADDAGSSEADGFEPEGAEPEERA